MYALGKTLEREESLSCLLQIIDICRKDLNFQIPRGGCNEAPVRDKLLQKVCEDLAAYVDASHATQEDIAIEDGDNMCRRKAAINDKATQGCIGRNLWLLSGKRPH